MLKYFILLLCSLAIPASFGMKSVASLYIYGKKAPVILTLKDTSGHIKNKLNIPLTSKQLDCDSLSKKLKDANYSLNAKSVVYLADDNNIESFYPCKKKSKAS